MFGQCQSTVLTMCEMPLKPQSMLCVCSNTACMNMLMDGAMIIMNAHLVLSGQLVRFMMLVVI